jgi:hypothetical protein
MAIDRALQSVNGSHSVVTLLIACRDSELIPLTAKEEEEECISEQEGTGEAATSSRDHEIESLSLGRNRSGSGGSTGTSPLPGISNVRKRVPLAN